MSLDKVMGLVRDYFGINIPFFQGQLLNFEKENGFSFKFPDKLEREIEIVNRAREGITNDEALTVSELERRAKHYVSSLGLENATVDFVRLDYGQRKSRSGVYTDIAYGSCRVPLQIEAEGLESIIIAKQYDDEGYLSNEKKILRLFQKTKPNFAPRVHEMFEDFYAEERVDPNSKSLEIMADHHIGVRKGLVMGKANEEALIETINKGVRIFADLLHIGIDYNHRHFMDEVYETPEGRVVLVDYGTSTTLPDDPNCFKDYIDRIKLFYELADMSEDERLQTTEERGMYFTSLAGKMDGMVEFFARETSFYRGNKNTFAAIQRIKDELFPDLKLDSENKEWMELYKVGRVLVKAAKGIKNYFESVGNIHLWNVSDRQDAWRYTETIFPQVIDAFIDQYKNSEYSSE